MSTCDTRTGTVFGVLIAGRREAASFSSNECEFLSQLSDHVALATHQAQLYATLQQAYDDLQQSQQTVMQQERLRALGQMASGVAHDINNAIAPIALYTDSLLEHEPGLTERLVEDGDIPVHVDHVLNKPPKLRDLRAALARLSG